MPPAAAPAGHFIHYQPSLQAGLFSTCSFQDKALFSGQEKSPQAPTGRGTSSEELPHHHPVFTAGNGRAGPAATARRRLPARSHGSPLHQISSPHVAHAQIHVLLLGPLHFCKFCKKTTFVSWQQRKKPHLTPAQIKVLTMPMAAHCLPFLHQPRVGFGFFFFFELNSIAWHPRSIYKRSI